MDKKELLKQQISDMIMEVANLYDEMITSDLQGIADVKAEDIIKLVGESNTDNSQPDDPVSVKIS